MLYTDAGLDIAGLDMVTNKVSVMLVYMYHSNQWCSQKGYGCMSPCHRRKILL